MNRLLVIAAALLANIGSAAALQPNAVLVLADESNV